ncbi:MAG: aconitase family protein [Aquificota bacterium]|nr:aconitase family protein [Aquificota bacterium]
MLKGVHKKQERYMFLKWAQKTFKNFRVIPPGAGIIHQVNIEFLAELVMKGKDGKSGTALFLTPFLGRIHTPQW